MEKYKPQRKFRSEKMSSINVSYKTEFVSNFKEACNKLNETQSAVLRTAMEETIMKSNNLITKYSIDYGYYTELDENGNVQDLRPCEEHQLFDSLEVAKKEFEKAQAPSPKGYVELSEITFTKLEYSNNNLSINDYENIVNNESLEIKI